MKHKHKYTKSKNQIMSLLSDSFKKSNYPDEFEVNRIIRELNGNVTKEEVKFWFSEQRKINSNNITLAINDSDINSTRCKSKGGGVPRY